jgi:hypothetical protein
MNDRQPRRFLIHFALAWFCAFVPIPFVFTWIAPGMNDLFSFCVWPATIVLCPLAATLSVVCVRGIASRSDAAKIIPVVLLAFASNIVAIAFAVGVFFRFGIRC